MSITKLIARGMLIFAITLAVMASYDIFAIVLLCVNHNWAIVHQEVGIYLGLFVGCAINILFLRK